MWLFADWIQNHWLDALQSAGIVGGLLFSGFAARRESRSRKIENLLSIHDSHRTIWAQAFENPRLLRILSKDLDLKKRPVTLQERLFVNFIILQITAVLEAVRAGVMAKPAGADQDIAEFMALPIPKAVWHATVKFRDKRTVRYFERLAGKGKLPRRGSWFRRICRP